MILAAKYPFYQDNREGKYLLGFHITSWDDWKLRSLKVLYVRIMNPFRDYM